MEDSGRHMNTDDTDWTDSHGFFPSAIIRKIPHCIWLYCGINQEADNNINKFTNS